MNDTEAERVALAILELAVTVRDEGPDAVAHTAREVLRAAGGDPIAALVVAAALVDTDAPVVPWWQDKAAQPWPQVTRQAVAQHGTRSGFQRHRRDGETPCAACSEAEQTYQAERYQRRKKAA